MKNLSFLCYALNAVVFVFSKEVRYLQLGKKVPGNGDASMCSLSSDGKTVVIGTPSYDGVYGVDSGRVQVYDYVGNQWLQIGDDIYGESADDYSGVSVSISSNGRIGSLQWKCAGIFL